MWGNWSDAQVDNAVKGFAKTLGWNPKKSQKGNVASAIGFLQRKFKVNYDQRYSSNVGKLFNKFYCYRQGQTGFSNYYS